jgi:hypothetical protein
MEYWNNGILEYWAEDNTSHFYHPIFQHSIIPVAGQENRD